MKLYLWAGLPAAASSHGQPRHPINSWCSGCWRQNLRDSRIALLTSGVVILVQLALFLAIGILRRLYYFYGHVTKARLRRIRSYFPAFIVTRDAARHRRANGRGAILAAGHVEPQRQPFQLAQLHAAWSFLLALVKPNADERERARLSRAMTVFWAALLLCWQ